MAIFDGTAEEWEALKAALASNCEACPKDLHQICELHRDLLYGDQKFLNLQLGLRRDRARLLLEEGRR